MESTARSLSVSFRGDGAGSYPLSWSQRWLWRVFGLSATDLRHRCLTVTVPVPAGRDVDTVLQAVSALLADHQSLRTRFHVDEHGEPRQVVVGEGEVVVETVDVEMSGSPQEMVDRLASEFGRAPYVASEPALRLLIVTANETPTHVILAVSHLSTDVWAIHVVKGDLARIMSGTGDEEGRRRKVEQLPDRVAYESSAEGVRLSERSIRYWKEQVTHFPPRDHRPSRSLPEPSRSRQVSMRSDAVGTAVQILSSRLRVGTSAVFIGLSAVLLTQRSGARRASFLLVCHNRFEPSASALSGPLVQDFPLSVEVGRHRPEELLRMAHAGVVDGAFSAQYDPVSLHTMLDDLTETHGVLPDLSHVVNVRTNKSRVSRSGRELARHVTGDDLRTLAQSTKWSDDVAREQTDINFYLTAALRGGEAMVTLRANTDYLSESDIREFLGDLEDLCLAWVDHVR